MSRNLKSGPSRQSHSCTLLLRAAIRGNTRQYATIENTTSFTRKENLQASTSSKFIIHLYTDLITAPPILVMLGVYGADRVALEASWFVDLVICRTSLEVVKETLWRTAC